MTPQSFMICSVMAEQPTPSETTAQADAWRPAMVRQIEMLGEMAEAGFDMVMAMRRLAVATMDAPAPTMDVEALGLAFSRVSRAVRMTLALQAKAIEDIRAFDRGDAPKAKPAASPADVRRRRVKGVVDRAILAEHGAGREFEQMSRFAERLLEDEDLCDDILSKPMSELVDMICRDLGLKPDWTLFAEETWAQREVDSGEVGKPLKDPEAYTAAAHAPTQYDVRWLDSDEKCENASP
jgi:hypothetical protein